MAVEWRTRAIVVEPALKLIGVWAGRARSRVGGDGSGLGLGRRDCGSAGPAVTRWERSGRWSAFQAEPVAPLMQGGMLFGPKTREGKTVKKEQTRLEKFLAAKRGR